MTGNAIELADLTKKYGSFTAVNHLNLTVNKGEIFGLLGPNGAGKSTTILMMLGLTDPTSGSVNVCGINPTKSPVEVKKKVGYLPEDVGFYDEMTGLENLVYTARLNQLPDIIAKHNAEELLNRVGLSGEAQKKTGKYSRGMRQRLGLADVLIKRPEVLILDEPTLGIDPRGVMEFLDLIVGLSKKDGLTVLFSSHHLHQVQQVCDRVGLFVNGNLLAQGDIQTLSHELFTKSAFIVEIGVSDNSKSISVLNKKEISTEWLADILKPVAGINAVHALGEIFRIECSDDLTSDIARAVVQSGIGLNYLNKKEYGLDDIYNRYFEGDQNHE